MFYLYLLDSNMKETVPDLLFVLISFLSNDKEQQIKSIIFHLHSIMTLFTKIDSHDCAPAFPSAFIQMSEFILFLLQQKLTTVLSIIRQEVEKRRSVPSVHSCRFLGKSS